MKTLFLDFDGTICHDRFWRSLSVDENADIQNYLFSGKNQIVLDWMKGIYTSEEINQLVADKTGLNYDYIWNNFVHDCKTMFVPQSILEKISILKNRYHVVLITGNMDCFDRFTIPSLELNTHFDVIVNSYNEKQLKTDSGGESFLKYVQGDITDAILIEDAAKSCLIFESLGGTAYQTQNSKNTERILESILKEQLHS